MIQWDMHRGANQQFRIEPLGDGQFALRSVHSGKVLDVAGASLVDGAPVLQWDWHGGGNQRFWIDHTGDDLFAVRSVHSGKVLDVSGWSTAAGAPIQQWAMHGGNNQLWQIVMPAPRPAHKPGGAVRFDDEP